MNDGDRFGAASARTGGATAASEAEGVDVLVVDDDDAVRSSVADILRLAGYTTAEAEDGLVALEILRSTKVGVLVLDIRMPRLDGFGVLDALADPPPVILMSAYSREDDPRGATASVFWYLKKPLQPRTLLEAVQKALGHTAG
ncbi:MAG: response regulator [Acidimicrobiales bacterium]